MATIYYKIPLTNIPMRMITVLAGGEYIFQTQYRDTEEGGWILDIDASSNEAPIIHGIPLVTGVDLLEQYEYLNFGGRLVLYADDRDDSSPGFYDLGVHHHLYFERDV
jgi:hypothetical protein